MTLNVSRIIHEILRISRFGLVGFLASAVHLAVAALLLAWQPGVHEFLVNLVAYICAFLFSLVGHQRFTFQQRARLLPFILMSWLGLAVNNLILYMALKLGFSGFTAIAPAVLLAAGVSYFVARTWVFRRGITP